MNILQIGCNDCNDKLYSKVKENFQLIKNLICVDPLPESIVSDKKAYESLGNRLTTICTAVVADGNSIIEMYHPEGHPGSGWSSSNKDHVEKHFSSITTDPKVRKILVPTTNINYLLEKLGIINYDLLNIDTEGSDCDILLSLDMNRFSFREIIFEFVHSDGCHTVGKKLDSLLNKLSNNGYKNITRYDEYNILASRV